MTLDDAVGQDARSSVCEVVQVNVFDRLYHNQQSHVGHVTISTHTRRIGVAYSDIDFRFYYIQYVANGLFISFYVWFSKLVLSK